MIKPTTISGQARSRGRALSRGWRAGLPERVSVQSPPVPHLGKSYRTERSCIMRYFLANVIFAALAISPALAASKPVPFIRHIYDNPQPALPILAHSWPDLIKYNNTQIIQLIGKPSVPGQNERLILDIAVVPIIDGTATISMNTTGGPDCVGIAISSHDTYPHNMQCPARITINRHGKYRTLTLGTLCAVDYGKKDDIAFAKFDPETNTIKTYIIIDGKKVADDGFGGNCNKIIKLSN